MNLDFTGIRKLNSNKIIEPQKVEKKEEKHEEIKGQNNIFDDFEKQRRDLKNREKNIEKERLKFSESEKIKIEILKDLSNGESYKETLLKSIDYIAVATGDKTFKNQALEIIEKEETQSESLEDKIIKLANEGQSLNEELKTASKNRQIDIKKRLDEIEEILQEINKKY